MEHIHNAHAILQILCKNLAHKQKIYKFTCFTQVGTQNFVANQKDERNP
jgi:hypothetical protein